jgi:hypothetical protein
MQTVQGFVRQNAWGKTPHSLQTVRETGVLHCPWGHTQADVNEYLADPANFSKKYAHMFVEFDVGSKILVAEAGCPEVLLVEITSPTQTGRIPHYAIVRSERPCNHSLTQPGRSCNNGCPDCEDSVRQVVRTHLPMTEFLKEGLLVEPFYSIWRSVRVLGSIDISDPLNQDIQKYTAYMGSIKKTPFEVPETVVRSEN